jgi:hypothetical protein
MLPVDTKRLPSCDVVKQIATDICSCAQFPVFAVHSLCRFIKATLPLAYGGRFSVCSARACVWTNLVTGDVHGQESVLDAEKAVGDMYIPTYDACNSRMA